MSYIVIAPACQVKFTDPATNDVSVATLYKDAPVPSNILQESLEHLLTLGFIADTSVPEVTDPSDDPDGPGGVPAKSANKDEWVAYAEAQGDADAASKTKDELIAEHGGS